MKLLPIFICLGLLAPGCATVKRAAAVAVVESDRVADEFARAWLDAAHEQVATCREILPSDATKDARLKCLGPYTPRETDKAIAGLTALIAAQQVVQLAVECEAFKSCTEPPDWAAISRDMLDAWQALKPYAVALKTRR